MSKCANCKNAILKKGAYDNVMYAECKFKQNSSQLTMEELLYRVKHPDEFCKFEEGEPTMGGTTYDD